MKSESANPGNDFQPEVYPPKRDKWFVATFWLIGISIYGLPLIAWPEILSNWFPFSIALPISVLIAIAYDLWAVRSTYYEMEYDHLLIRYGSVRRRTLYRDIVEVRPSRHFVRYKRSHFALSRDCLLICHRSWEIHKWLSPEDKEAFMRDLASRSPDLNYQEGQVIRIDKADRGATL